MYSCIFEGAGQPTPKTDISVLGSKVLKTGDIFVNDSDSIMLVAKPINVQGASEKVSPFLFSLNTNNYIATLMVQPNKNDLAVKMVNKLLECSTSVGKIDEMTCPPERSPIVMLE